MARKTQFLYKRTKRTQILIMFAVVCGLALTPGCSTTQKPKTTAQTLAKPMGVNTHTERVSISYVLGRSKRKFRIEAKEKQFIVQTILDRQILMEGVIDQERFDSFMRKLTEFVMGFKSPEPLSLESCRTPFTVEIVIENNLTKIEGCRSPEDTTLSRILREGEFLIYSKK